MRLNDFTVPEFTTLLCLFQGHGWCSKDKFCPKSHNIDLIIDMDVYMETRKSRKRKRRQQNREKRESLNQSIDKEMNEDDQSSAKEDQCVDNEETTEVTVKLSSSEIIAKLKEISEEAVDMNGSHRAGFDAFMTGFIFAVFRYKYPEKVNEWMNKLYLTGKDYPLSVSKSTFVKQSQEHLDKITEIRKNSATA